MRRKMLRRCSIFNCFSLLNFSTLELFLAAVLHHYWISQPLFWFISVVLYFCGALWALIQQGFLFSHCTCSQMHKLITIIYQRQIFLGHLVQFGSPQLWVVASVWQGIGSCELRRLDPEQLLHYVALHWRMRDEIDEDPILLLCGNLQITVALPQISPTGSYKSRFKTAQIHKDEFLVL